MPNYATHKNVPVLKHEPGNVRLHSWQGKKNTINNRVFALWAAGRRRILVEVVRSGEKTTRIRRSLSSNSSTFLTETRRLSDYHYRDEEFVPTDLDTKAVLSLPVHEQDTDGTVSEANEPTPLVEATSESQAFEAIFQPTSTTTVEELIEDYLSRPLSEDPTDSPLIQQAFPADGSDGPESLRSLFRL